MTVLSLLVVTGCKSTRELLTVDFQEGQKLRYKFVSSREGQLDWQGSGSKGEKTSGAVTKFSESFETVMSYEPIEVNPFGASTIRATCESIKIKRWSDKAVSSKQIIDAAKTLKGKSFIFRVQPNGRIENHSQLRAILKDAGEKAFRKNSSSKRIKEPDMLSDFTATQYFLWDSISSIEDPSRGMKVGQSWESKLLIPTPFVSKMAREVTYTLKEIREPSEESQGDKKRKKSGQPKDRIAVIKSESHFYSIEELTRILAREAENLNLKSNKRAFQQIALRSNGHPETAKQLLKKVSKHPKVKDSGVLTPENVKNALKKIEIDDRSFTDAPASWPLPYDGSFSPAGRFGFLRNYQLESLHGKGEELFNLDKGRIEQITQRYKVEFSTSLYIPLPGTSPRVSFEQKLSMRLLNK